MNRSQNTLPVYERIKNSIRRRIESGELAPGTRIPSEHQLARELGVSRNQTRQAMRELALEGLISRRRGSGSYVAPSAGEVPSVNVAGVSDTVALVFPRYFSRFCREVVDGFLQRMAQEGRPTIAYNIEEPDHDTELRTLRTVASSGVAGLAVWIEHDTPGNRSFFADARARNLPAVLMDRQLQGTGIDFVGSCHETIGYRLTQALLDRGHKRIAFAGWAEKDWPSSVELRAKGYLRALREAGIEPDPRLRIDKVRLYANPAAETAAIMGLRDVPTAFCCSHDRIAGHVYREVKRLDYRVPNHVELAAVDDGYTPEDAHIPLLTVAQQSRRIGVESAEVLLARIDAPDRHPECRSIEPGPLRKGNEEATGVRIDAGKGGVPSAERLPA